MNHLSLIFWSCFPINSGLILSPYLMPANSFILLEKESSCFLFFGLLLDYIGPVDGRDTASLSDCGVILVGRDPTVL